MSNPPTNPTPVKGGMPKWLIILLVIFLLIVLGCCGGFVTCTFLARKAAEKIKENAAPLQQQIEERAQQAVRDAAAREANGGGNGGSSGGGGTTAGGGNAGGGGFVVPGVNQLPSNFPKDIPVMNGLNPTGMAVADNVKGAGGVTLFGTAKPADVVTYYTSNMKDKGWSMDQNMNIGPSTLMVFTKDNRQANLQVTTTDNQTVVNVTYGNK